MYEKVNPSHPDKVADRIAGAIVDIAYSRKENPKVAVECLIGHGLCTVIIESNVVFSGNEIEKVIERISPSKVEVKIIDCRQDEHLFNNQKDIIKCGDNGIFKGLPITEEEKILSEISRKIYKKFNYDGKYIINTKIKNSYLPRYDLIICQSNAKNEKIETLLKKYFNTESFNLYLSKLQINPLGEWTGGTDVDTGAVNRKLGSDMAFAVTGGGIHGKDLSKADVTLNIYAHLKAQELNEPVEIYCAIGDEYVDGKKYSEIVEIARSYINKLGGFEKFAEWGIIR